MNCLEATKPGCALNASSNVWAEDGMSNIRPTLHSEKFISPKRWSRKYAAPHLISLFSYSTTIYQCIMTWAVSDLIVYAHGAYVKHQTWLGWLRHIGAAMAWAPWQAMMAPGIMPNSTTRLQNEVSSYLIANYIVAVALAVSHCRAEWRAFYL